MPVAASGAGTCSAACRQHNSFFVATGPLPLHIHATMDLEILKKMVADDPAMWARCFIISYDFCELPSQTKRNICRVLGEENMVAMEFIADRLILVTVKDSNTRDYLLAAFCDIHLLTGRVGDRQLPVMPVTPQEKTFKTLFIHKPLKIALTDTVTTQGEILQPSSSCEKHRGISQVRYRLHPVAPVSAQVMAAVSGIPYVLVNTHKSPLAQEISKVFPQLSSIRFECLRWHGQSVVCGSIMSSVTSDLRTTIEDLSGDGKSITFGGFLLHMSLKSTAPLTQTTSLPDRQDCDNIYVGW